MEGKKIGEIAAHNRKVAYLSFALSETKDLSIGPQMIFWVKISTRQKHDRTNTHIPFQTKRF